MKRNRIVATSVAAAVVLGFGLTACSSDDGSSGGKSPSPTKAAEKTGQTIRVWFIQPDKNSQGPANDYLKKTFEAEHPGNKLVVEEQQWGTYVDKYQAALSGNDAPDVVEMGNTDTPRFTAEGALLDLTDKKADLGGDDLLPGFVNIGSYDGKFFAPPYYSGARVVFYSANTVKQAVPKTLDEYVSTGVANKTDKFSGIYQPGKDWYNVLPYVWANGGFIAKQGDDSKWTAGFSSDGGVKGLEMAQKVMTQANSKTVAPPDGDESKGTQVFCQGKIGYLAGPTWLGGSIMAPKDADAPGCPDTYGKDLKSFALPGLTEGSVAPTFAGGSNIGIPSKSKNPELAYDALKIVLSDGYQDLIASKGLIPAKVSQASSLPTDDATQQGAKAAAAAILTPASPKWSEVEAKGYLKDAFTKLAQGGDVKSIATALDKQITDTLNAS